jgi:hypothetical protein
MTTLTAGALSGRHMKYTLASRRNGPLVSAQRRAASGTGMRGEAAEIRPFPRGRAVRMEVSRPAAISPATRRRLAHLTTVWRHGAAGVARADNREPGRWPAADLALTSEEAMRELEAGTPSEEQGGDVPDREPLNSLEGYPVEVLDAILQG